MFEARLKDGMILKQIVQAIKELVTEVNIDVSPDGLHIQAMDSSHVALVNLRLNKSGFEFYRCEKPMTLGLSVTNLCKVMKLVNNHD